MTVASAWVRLLIASKIALVALSMPCTFLVIRCVFHYKEQAQLPITSDQQLANCDVPSHTLDQQMASPSCAWLFIGNMKRKSEADQVCC